MQFHILSKYSKIKFQSSSLNLKTTVLNRSIKSIINIENSSVTLFWNYFSIIKYYFILSNQFFLGAISPLIESTSSPSSHGAVSQPLRSHPEVLFICCMPFIAWHRTNDRLLNHSRERRFTLCPCVWRRNYELLKCLIISFPHLVR